MSGFGSVVVFRVCEKSAFDMTAMNIMAFAQISYLKVNTRQ